MKNKIVKIARSPSYSEYIRLVNGIFKLTDKEIEVLAKFIEYQIEHKDFNVFSAEFKKRIAQDLGMKDFNILNIYIKSLKDKRAIAPTLDGYTIKPILIKTPNQTGLSFEWN